MALTALAGPVSNLLLAFLFLLLLRFVGFGWLWQISYPTQFAATMAYFFILFLYYGVQMNVTLAVFNLLPVPPLDGSRLLTAILPSKIYFRIMRYEKYIYLFLIGWLFLGSYVARALLSIPFVAASPVLSFIASLFSLSGLLSRLIATVFYGIFDLWLLIPFLQY